MPGSQGSQESSFQVGEFIATNFEDGVLIGEVKNIIDRGTFKVSYMLPFKVKTADPSEHPRRFWHWPRKKVIYDTNKVYIIPIRPSNLVLAVPPSTNSNLIFRLDNIDILEKFCL